MSVKWKMEGIDINFDTNIGKWLSKLGDTVTSLADTQSIRDVRFLLPPCNFKQLLISSNRQTMNKTLRYND